MRKASRLSVVSMDRMPSTSRLPRHGHYVTRTPINWARLGVIAAVMFVAVAASVGYVWASPAVVVEHRLSKADYLAARDMTVADWLAERIAHNKAHREASGRSQ